MPNSHPAPPGLGIDAGGTQTRWALARADGAIVAEGAVAGLSALQLGSGTGRAAGQPVLAGLASAVRACARPGHICAGLTGLSGEDPDIAAWLAALFDLPPSAVTLRSDIETAFLDCFAPGAGYLVYAGTGSIGAYIDAAGTLHRAGGRGVMLDDGGGGFWIAREAMRHIWRLEDERPGAWQSSPMARAVFEAVGGSAWACSRQFMYGQERGAVGRLALTVAASAAADPVAAAILRAAGAELARLARALVTRFGPRPVALAGRASTLHPSIGAAMRAALDPSIALQAVTTRAHHAAARMAARTASHVNEGTASP